MSIITLTTDIGQQDYLVAAVKGQLYSVSENLTIVDVSHQLSSFNYPQAAYFCDSAFKHFPSGTFHIVLVNMFDQKPKQMLLAYHNKQCSMFNWIQNVQVSDTTMMRKEPKED